MIPESLSRLRRRPMTRAAYLATPESPAKCSFLEGVLIEEPPPSDEHQGIVANLGRHLLAEVKRTGAGVVRPAP